jgi:ankyrin repeat protein
LRTAQRLQVWNYASILLFPVNGYPILTMMKGMWSSIKTNIMHMYRSKLMENVNIYRKNYFSQRCLTSLSVLMLIVLSAVTPLSEAAENENFTTLDAKIWKAIAEDDSEGVVAALKAGAYVDSEQVPKELLDGYHIPKGSSPLIATILWENSELALLLLSHGADPESRTAQGLTAVQMAVAVGDEQLFSALVAKGADIKSDLPRTKNPDQGRLIDLAARGGSLKILSAVMAAGHALPTARQDKIRLLIQSIWGAPQLEMFEHLLRETGLDMTPEITREMVETALQYNSKPFLQFFYKQGYLVNDSLKLTLEHSLWAGMEDLAGEILTGHPELWETDLTEAIAQRIKLSDPQPMVDLFFRFNMEDRLLPFIKDLFSYCGRKGDLEKIRSLLGQFHIEKSQEPRLLGVALLGAVKGRSDNMIDGLLEQPRIDVNVADENGETPLYYAIRYKNQALASRLLANGAKARLDNSDPDRSLSFMHEACRQGMNEIIAPLLAAGANLEEEDYRKEFTPLGCAVDMKNVAMVRQLLMAGADPNYFSSRLRFSTTEKDNPFLNAVAEKDEALVAPFVQPGNPKKVAPGLLGNGLATAIDLNQAEIVERIVPAVKDLNQPISGLRSYAGTPPVIYAIEAGRPGMIAPLLKHGAKLVPEEYTAADLVCYACSRQGEELARILLDAGLSSKVLCGDMPLLSVAVTDSGPELVNLLLNRGADIDAPIEEGEARGWTPLMFAVANDKPQLVELLTEKGAKTNVSGFSLVEGGGQWEKKPATITPLIKAAEMGNAEIIRTLIQAGADINQTNNERFTALMTAARFARLDAVKTLLLLGADVSPINNYDHGALGLAALSGDADVQKLLLDKTGDREKEIALLVAAQLAVYDYIDVLTAEREFTTEALNKALQGALQTGAPKWRDPAEPPLTEDFEPRLKTIRTLVKAGGNVDADLRGTTCYQVLLNTNYTVAWKKRMVRLLNELGADINLPMYNSGTTPLHEVTRLNSAELTALLLELGADLCLKDNMGMTPLDRANENPGNTTSKELIKGGSLKCNI